MRQGGNTNAVARGHPRSCWVYTHSVWDSTAHLRAQLRAQSSELIRVSFLGLTLICVAIAHGIKQHKLHHP